MATVSITCNIPAAKTMIGCGPLLEIGSQREKRPDGANNRDTERPSLAIFLRHIYVQDVLSFFVRGLYGAFPIVFLFWFFVCYVDANHRVFSEEVTLGRDSTMTDLVGICHGFPWDL